MKKIMLEDKDLETINGGVLDELYAARNKEAINALLNRLNVSLSSSFDELNLYTSGKSCTNTRPVHRRN